MLQHRGQDAAGIATVFEDRFYLHKGNGLITDVFDAPGMARLLGHAGIGHVRYPTAGCGSVAEAQPFYVNSPYGIVFAKGALWYNESFAKPNTIVRFDPKTEKFQTWAIPGGGDIVRNMDVTPDGNPVTANSLTNQVGLVEIK